MQERNIHWQAEVPVSRGRQTVIFLLALAGLLFGLYLLAFRGEWRGLGIVLPTPILLATYRSPDRVQFFLSPEAAFSRVTAIGSRAIEWPVAAALTFAPDRVTLASRPHLFGPKRIVLHLPPDPELRARIELSVLGLAGDRP